MVQVEHSEEKKVKANNIEINYDTFGESSNPAILLIQGLTAQMVQWKEEFCQNLASKGYFVIRFDNRDVGLSSKMDDAPVPNIKKLVSDIQQRKPISVPYKLTDMANDAVGLLDALDIKSAHIVGASMGGMIAQTVAIEHPNRVKTLTSLFSETGNLKLNQIKPEALAVLLTPPPVDRDKFIEFSLKGWKVLHGTKYSYNEHYIKEMSALVYDRCFYPKGIARQFAAILASGSRNKQLKDIKIPTLVIHGNTDPLIPVEAGKETADVIPGAELEIIEGMGHDIPDEVAPQIIESIIKQTKKNL